MVGPSPTQIAHHGVQNHKTVGFEAREVKENLVPSNFSPETFRILVVSETVLFTVSGAAFSLVPQADSTNTSKIEIEAALVLRDLVTVSP